MRVCYGCTIEKPLEDFGKDKKSREGRLTICKACRKNRESPASRKKRIDRNCLGSKKAHALRKAAGLPTRSLDWRKRNLEKSILKSRSVSRSESGRAEGAKRKEKRIISPEEKARNEKKNKEWRLKNMARRLAGTAVYNMIAKNEIKKPSDCPRCSKPTTSRKMYLRLDESLDTKNPMWLCSKCTADEDIKNNSRIKWKFEKKGKK